MINLRFLLRFFVNRAPVTICVGVCQLMASTMLKLLIPFDSEGRHLLGRYDSWELNPSTLDLMLKPLHLHASHITVHFLTSCCVTCLCLTVPLFEKH